MSKLNQMHNRDQAKTNQSRRRFLYKSALAIGSFSIVPRFVIGGPGFTPPSDKITLGFIGTGKQSNGLGKRFLELEDIQMIAGCDVNTKHLDRFKNMVDQAYSEKGTSSGAGCATYSDYREMLERSDMDGVIIATPDHWHATQVIDAANAGKDIYCEKPLSHSIDQGRKMVEAVEQNELVFQTGSMQRSWDDFRKAVELVRNGYLGEIKEVKVSVGDAAVDCTLPSMPIPDYIDWDKWLGPAAYRGYHPEICPPIEDDSWAMWRKYKEFGGGILSDWGTHMFDIAQWALDMDQSGPVEIIPPGGDVEFLTFRYANGIPMTHEVFGRGHAVRFIGSEGQLDVSRQFLDSKPVSIANIEIKANDKRVYYSDNHYQDWIDGVKSRKQPICPVETGHRTATISQLGNITYWLDRPLTWDPAKEKFDGDSEANRLRSNKMRKPYRV